MKKNIEVSSGLPVLRSSHYIYNRNAFEDYLLRSTYLETGSTSKYGFATIYKDKGEYLIDMNVQIRFKA